MQKQQFKHHHYSPYPFVDRKCFIWIFWKKLFPAFLTEDGLSPWGKCSHQNNGSKIVCLHPPKIIDKKKTIKEKMWSTEHFPFENLYRLSPNEHLRYMNDVFSLREDLNREKTFSFGHCPNDGGGRVYPSPNFGPLSRSAFLVNKESLFLQKCVELHCGYFFSQTSSLGK